MTEETEVVYKSDVVNFSAMLNNYRLWYNERVEFMTEKGLDKEFWDWKVKKGYVLPQGGRPSNNQKPTKGATE